MNPSTRHMTLRFLMAGMFLAALPWAMAAADAPVTEGALHALDKEGQPVGMCPLEHTDVTVDISGFIARVTLTQRFGNPYTTPIEAVYTFPMSERAAVDSMTMTIGDRVIKGVIKEREEARRIYEAARDAGKAASLLDQERPNIFTQTVANILPGDTVNITISYVEYLKYEAGEYEFSFPMVVGPRYIPGAPATPPPDAILPEESPGLRPGPASTDQVPDASRITPPVTPKGTRAGHDIAVEVHLDAGVAIQDVKSELHEVEVERPGGSQAVVRLKDKKTIPNRDFVLRYAVAGPAIADAVLTHADQQGGFFTLILQPPDRVEAAQVTPKEMMFVIDCSGSMRGFPIEKAKATMRLAIEGMNPEDTFNLVTFAGGLGYCFDRPVPNTADNRKKALDYLSNLEGRGGTEMMAAINAALGGQNDPERLRVVCFMTDGFIGNDMAILDAIRKNAGTARVFSFGIGNSVNRFLIEGMARTGRGASEVVTLESDGDAAAKRFHERIQSPLLTDITVDFGDLPVEDIYPDIEAIPDLFAARPLVFKGRYSAPGDGFITVRGNTAAGPFERRVPVTLPGDEPAHDVLAPLWARERIAWLMEQDWLGAQQGKPNADTKGAVTELGLTFNLVTQYTSFVAVEERVITEGGKPKTVQVPVEMPDGVSYEGVFGEQEAIMAGKSARLGGGFATAAPASSAVRGVEGLSMADGAVRESLVRVQSVPEAPMPQAKPKDKDEAKGHPKLDKALWGLQAKLANGNYTEGAVKVRDGWVEVFVRLTDLTDDTLAALKKLGVEVVTEVHSRKLVVAKIRVADLERVAALDCVKRIEPPAF